MASDDNCECPLCMEPFEVDDMSFYPCTCGYQICRFCWHRLKIDGNGLCPACRKAYSENPAHFEPLSEDEIVRIKKERRHKEVQKKQKLTENRRHLSDVRVVQKNLVFVVGLSHRLADAEILKKTEYFGKFGKITKVVINSSPSYAGAQTPSASAYVTYSKADEALKAIQTVNNVQIDNRVLKASLGTTKYCSHFLKGIQCPKTDCMYLHDLGEENASFTKEQMSQGKHLEYESRLIENILNIPRNLQNISNDQANQIIINQIHQGLPSALLTHSSNSQQAQTSSSSSTTSTNSTTSNSNNHNPSTSSNHTNNSNNNNNTASFGTSTNGQNNLDKSEQRSRLKKASSSKHNSKATPHTSELTQQRHIASHNHNTHHNNHKSTNDHHTHHTNTNVKNSNEYHDSNTKINKEEDEDELSEELISEEEALTADKSVKVTESTTTKSNTVTKSYLSALNTEENSVKVATEEVVQEVKPVINYKDVLEKNIPAYVNEVESNDATEKTSQIKPRTSTTPKPTTTTTQTDNASINPSRDAISDLTHSLSTQHIVQEEDLGFDPWDEATKSLQDLMKIESSSHLTTSKPEFTKSISAEAASSSSSSTSSHSSTQNSQTKASTYTGQQGFNNNNEENNRQYFQQHSAQTAFNNTNGKTNDLQNFYKLHSTNGVNGAIPAEFSQMYQSHMHHNITNDDTNTQQKLNEMLQSVTGHYTNGTSGQGSDFAVNGPFNHENYLNKLLAQKQSLSKASISAPPGFNTNNIVFNSPISNSSTSSSSSSTSSSVNNSTSTTPALNNNANAANSAKSNPNACLLNDYTNEYIQDTSKQHQQETSSNLKSTNQAQLNPALLSNSLQDTFRSIFPNANISFGGSKQTKQPNFDSKLTNYAKTSGNNNNNTNQFNNSATSIDKNQQNIWPDDPAIVSLNNGLNGQFRDLNNDFQDRMQSEFNDNGYNNNPNKHLEQLSYLTSSLGQQQHQQPNNINNLANLLKKQQNDQFNNSLINQFQMLYQQHQLAQFQNSSSFLNSQLFNPMMSNQKLGNNSSNNNNNNNNNNNGNVNGNGNQDQMNNTNKSIEDLHNHHQKLLQLNNNHYNGLNGNSNNLLNNFLSNDLNQFSNPSNLNNYGYVIDSNQNIQSTSLNGALKSQQQQMTNNATANVLNGIPSLLNLQQQSYMQQLLMQNYNQNPTAATTNSNSD